MLDRLTRVQLAIFAVVTVITVVIMAIFYLRLPAAMGIGTYRVTANFVAGGGLYKNANVTYRGVAVGRVGGSHPRRRRRGDAAEQRYQCPVERHRVGEERVGHR
jgi:ABC-type transporter Mla subunit MlaD